MKLNDLKPTPGSKHRKKRAGRGKAAGRGTYAGRGIKGQKARGRMHKKAYFEGGQLPLVRRLPFKRGFTNVMRIDYQEVNVNQLDERFDAGDTVTPETLVEKGLLRDAETPVVILGRGDLSKNLSVHAHRVSKSAAEKIEQAGGSFEKLDLLVTGIAATIRKKPKAELEALRAQKQNG